MNILQIVERYLEVLNLFARKMNEYGSMKIVWTSGGGGFTQIQTVWTYFMEFGSMKTFNLAQQAACLWLQFVVLGLENDSASEEMFLYILFILDG